MNAMLKGERCAEMEEYAENEGERKPDVTLRLHVPSSNFSRIPVYAGLREDFEMLFATFKQRNSPRYTEFGNAFGELGFGLIFAGRQSEAELLEFEEHLLRMAATYMFSRRGDDHAKRLAGYPKEDGVAGTTERAQQSPPAPNPGIARSRQTLEPIERIFGIYATFTLFQLQPANYAVKIRITPDELEDVLDFAEHYLLPHKHLDAIMTLQELLSDDAFMITAFGTPFNPSYQRMYDWLLGENPEDEVREGGGMLLATTKEAMRDPVFEEQEKLEESYAAAMAECQASCKEPLVVASTRTRETMEDILDAAELCVLQLNLMAEPAQDESVLANDRAAAREERKKTRAELRERAHKAKVMATRSRRYAVKQEVQEQQQQQEGKTDEEKKRVSVKIEREQSKQTVVAETKKSVKEKKQERGSPAPPNTSNLAAELDNLVDAIQQLDDDDVVTVSECEEEASI